MNDFIGTIKLFAGNFAPQGWRFCDGCLLSVRQYEILFSVIGATYGGDGETTFALPDLRNKVPVGKDSTTYQSKRSKGCASAQTVQDQFSRHHHASNEHDAVDRTVNAGNYRTTNSARRNRGGASAEEDNNFSKAYAAGKMAVMPSEPVSTQIDRNTKISVGAQPSSNKQPFLALNYIICINGMYPQP